MRWANPVDLGLDAHGQRIYISLMDTTFELQGQTFEWDSKKAATNLRKHRVSSEHTLGKEEL